MTDRTPAAVDPAEQRLVDPRAVRVSVADAAPEDAQPIVVEPPAVPLGPDTHLGGHGVLGGIAVPTHTLLAAGSDESGTILVDGRPVQATLERLDGVHAVLREGASDVGTRIRVVLGPSVADADRGVHRREVLVDGWRIELEVESERRASLRERARRGTTVAHGGGPTEVRAIIPGRIVSVSVGPGDEVVAGQQLLVVEAMKMQNELRAPRDGTIDAVSVAPGDTIDVRDLLLVLR